MDGVLTPPTKWCSTSRSADAQVPRPRRFPGWLPELCRWCCGLRRGLSVADFCRHVDTRIREALQHQRFPVHILERKVHLRRPGQAADRVGVNFVPSTTILPFAEATAAASYTTVGRVDHVGLFFFNADGQLFLSTVGSGQPYTDFDASDSAQRLRAGVGGDDRRSEHGRCRRWSCSTAAEHARLDGGNRAMLTQPATAPVSIPALFAAQVARAPEAVAMSCGENSWTYRELDEAANRLAHLLAGQGVGPGSVWRCCWPVRPRRSWRFWRCSRPGRPICRSTRGCLRRGWSSWLPMPRRSPRSPRRTCVRGWTGAICRSSTPTTPLLTANPARHYRRRPRGHRLPHLHLGHHRRPQGGGRHPAQRHPVVRTLEIDVELAPGQVWTQCHSYAFDFSVWEIWGALLHGGRLVVVPESVAHSSEDFHALLVANASACSPRLPRRWGCSPRRGWSRRR